MVLNNIQSDPAMESIVLYMLSSITDLIDSTGIFDRLILWIDGPTKKLSYDTTYDEALSISIIRIID